mgnify:CR=1 FL=1
MTTLQKVIKYLSIIFGIFLIFVIISSILGIGYTVNKILSPNKYDDIKEEITNVIDDIKDNTNDNSNNEEPTKDIELTQEEFNNIKIDLTYSDLEINTGEFKVETNSDNIVTKIKDKTLIIKEKNTWNIKFKNKQKVILYLPSNIELTEVEINNGSGKLYIASIIANNIDLDLGAGSTNIDNIIASNTDIDTDAGTLNIDNGIINNLDLDLGVGKTTINAKLTGKNKIDIGVGSFYLNVLDNISNYKLKLNKGIGTIKVNDEEIKNDTTIGTGDNIINISGGVGSINIDFKE